MKEGREGDRKEGQTHTHFTLVRTQQLIKTAANSELLRPIIMSMPAENT